jgi:hypothetical protein
MTTLTTAWMLAGVWGSGFVFGAVVASGRRRPRGNGNCVPMPPAPPYSSAAIAWRDAETQRGNGNGGTTTPKPPIKPQFPPPRKIREDFLPHHHESHE